VLYSSITIFVAVEARMLLGRRLSRRQWFGILLTTSGLLVSALGSGMLDGGLAEGTLPFGLQFVTYLGHREQLFGILVTMCSTLVYSAIYTISDYLVSSPIPISTQKLSTISGNGKR
jgi:drug/metabolite transporter (DMT)-like permease